MIKTIKLLIITALILALNSIPVFSAETKTYGELLHNLEIVYGLDEGLEEAKEITRGEMIVLLVRMLVSESGFNSYVLPEIPSFSDVPASHWAYTEIEIAKQIGITSGLDDGSFGIDLPVTYTQTVLFLARALHYDTSAMLYNNSVYLIREATGLTLESNAGPHTALKRGQVFELISHALSKNIKDTNQLLISSLTIDGNLENQFLIDYPNAVQSYVTNVSSKNDEDLLNFKNGYQYSSYDLYAKSLALVERYPQILEMEILGYSTDERPIYVIRMTNPINESSENSYVGKMHLFIDAGVHARETYNPFLVLRIIEDYAKDYYNNATIPSADINALLQNNVIHFMPLLNPDGFDIVKFGPGMIKNPVLKADFIQLLGRDNYRRLKANVRGVDLNRNYTDEIFDTNTSLWKSVRGVTFGDALDYSYPKIEFFSGYSAASEVETRISQDYMLRYDFRAYLSYHSQGRIVSAETSGYGLELENQSIQHEKLLRSLTGYGASSSYASAYGYAGRFASFNTNKSYSTIETMNTTTYPDDRWLYKSEYDKYKLNQAPLVLLSQAQKDGYAPYKIYVNNRYVRDSMSKVYAYAIAEKLGGNVAVYAGEPILYLE